MITQLDEMKILIPTFSTMELVDTNEIIAIHADDNYCIVVLNDAVTIESTKAIGKFGDELDSLGFCKCHKSHLINLSKVIRYHKEGLAEMIDGSKIPVARRRKEEFLNHFQHNIDFQSINHPKKKNKSLTSLKNLNQCAAL